MDTKKCLNSKSNLQSSKVNFVGFEFYQETTSLFQKSIESVEKIQNEIKDKNTNIIMI